MAATALGVLPLFVRPRLAAAYDVLTSVLGIRCHHCIAGPVLGLLCCTIAAAKGAR